MICTQQTLARRAGFTLVELLVVIGLGILLAAMTVGIANSNIADSYKVVGAADRVSEWLFTAKSQAQATGRPHGVRFFLNGNQITEAQYIEMPEPFVPFTQNANDPPRLILQNGPPRSVSAPGTTATQILNNVSAGDSLVLPEFGLTLPISNNNPLTVSNPALLPDLATGTSYTTSAFGFVRGPLPLIGEPNLQVPAGMMIDVRDFAAETGTSTSLFPTLNGNQFDILFSPSGEVLNAGAVPRIVLWIRNSSFLPPAISPRTNMAEAGQMVLVVVYPKTGAIATQPVLMPPTFGDPYQAAKDGVNTGL